MRWMVSLIAGWMLLASANLASAGVQDDIDSAKLAIRLYTAFSTPKATLTQAKNYGLFLPDKIDSTKPLVILIHGLDMTRGNWVPIADRLSAAGVQVAFFCYPEDQPIVDDVRSLRDRLADLRGDHPGLTIDVVAYSMGSLVARGYIEGSDYTGGVDRLIMLAPPNHGSSWARLAWLLKIREHAYLWWYDPDWRPSWFVTSGLCEAGRDLLPGSKFLKSLNALPRRDGVKYTIVEGDEHPARRIAAAVIDQSARCLPGRCGGTFLKAVLRSEATSLRQEPGDSDGPVTLGSAELVGVKDVVRVHADHETMIDSDGPNPPAAWETVRDRLARR